MALPPIEASASNVDLRQGSRRALIIGAVVTVLCAGGVAAFLISSDGASSGPPDATPIDAGFNYGEHARPIANLRGILSHRPCDKGTAVDLGETLNRAGDYHGAIRFVDEFVERCGEYRRLLWVKVTANQDLERWDKVAAVTTTLIEAMPHDSDYWWWRGRAYEKLGKKLKAASDYRHSVARGPNKYGSSRFADLLRAERPCAGAFAYSSYLQDYRNDPPAWARRELQKLYLAGDCDAMAGRGQASVRFMPGAPLPKVEGRINDAAGSFAIESDAAYLTLSRAFADKAGVTATGDATVTVFLTGAFIEASLAESEKVAVGKASASGVVVAVVDELPGDVDAIVGQSFLWRFRNRWEADRLVIEPLTAPPPE